MSNKTSIATDIVQKNNLPGTGNSFFERFEKQVIWHIVLLVLLPFFVYIKTAGFELINYDDVAIIKNNIDVLSHIKNIGIIFNTDAFISAHGDFYRPIQTASFMIDTLIGGGRPWIYHLMNLIYHILAVISLYFFLRSLNIKPLTAVFSAAVFSVHPLLTAAVSWVPARGDLLIGLFGILLFSSFRKFYTTKNWLYFILHALLFFLAVYSKEVSLIIPLLLVFYYFKILGKKFSVKEMAPFLMIWVGIFVSFYILRSKVVTGTPPDFIFGINPFLSNLPAIPIVIAKIFLPFNLSTMPLFETNFTIAGTLILMALLIIVIRTTLQKKWIAIFGFTWFVLLVAPPLLFKLYFSQYLVEYYEHRTYLPFIGIIILFASLLSNLSYNRSNKLFMLLPVAILLFFSYVASGHSDHFKNSLSFFGRATELKNPGAATKRGEMYMDERDFTNALSDFEEAINTSNGEYPPAFFNRGRIRSIVNKDHVAAESDFTQTISLDTSYIDAYIDRANERISNQNLPGAIADLEKAKQFDPSNARIYFTLGNVYVNAKDDSSAIPAYSKSISLDSSYSEAYNNRGYSYYKLHNLSSALIDYKKAVSLFPEYLNARYNTGMIYYETGKSDSAIYEFDTTLMLANNFYFGYFYRGMAKKQKNDMKGACNDWQESVKLGFTLAMDTIKRYCK